MTSWFLLASVTPGFSRDRQGACFSPSRPRSLRRAAAASVLTKLTKPLTREDIAPDNLAGNDGALLTDYRKTLPDMSVG
jgi:hypothetical protein